MPLIHIPGGQLDYTTSGSGHPACIIHQYAALSAADPLVESLSPFFTCYALNARGIADSGPVRGPEDLTMTALAADVEAARQALGKEQWVVVGASTGGMVALLYTLRYPQSISGLILIDTAASYRFVQGSLYDPQHPRATELTQASQAMMTGGPQAAAQWGRLIWSLSVANPQRTPPPDRPLGMSPHRMFAFIQHLHSFDLEGELGRIHVPTLVIVGQHDPQCPIENSERIAAGIPRASLVVCEQSGHFPYIEEPEIFHEAIRRFALDHGLSTPTPKAKEHDKDAGL